MIVGRGGRGGFVTMRPHLYIPFDTIKSEEQRLQTGFKLKSL